MLRSKLRMPQPLVLLEGGGMLLKASSVSEKEFSLPGRRLMGLSSVYSLAPPDREQVSQKRLEVMVLFFPVVCLQQLLF